VLSLRTRPIFRLEILEVQAMDRKRHTRSKMMAATEAAFTICIAALMLFNSENIVSAQNSQASSPAQTQSTGEPPIGWRTPFRVQPTVRDLPPGVAATETQRTKAQENFDRQLQICRGC
jgi:hypothetical protein